MTILRRVARIIARIIDPVLRFEADIQAYKDLQGDLVPWPTPPGINLATASMDQAMAIADMRAQYEGLKLHDEYRDRVRRGQECFIALAGEEILGSNWLCFNEGYEGPVRIQLARDEVLCMDAFVVPAARGRAIHTVLQRALIARAKELGFRIAYTFLIYDNPPAARTLQRMEWDVESHFRYIIISMPLLRRRFGWRRQFVLDLGRGRPPVPRAGWLRPPPFKSEP